MPRWLEKIWCFQTNEETVVELDEIKHKLVPHESPLHMAGAARSKILVKRAAKT